MAEIQLQSTLTCPHCGYQAKKTMPTDACLACYDCKGCGATLRPLPGSCCVFCSYGSVPCPPIQEGYGPDISEQLIREAESAVSTKSIPGSGRRVRVRIASDPCRGADPRCEGQ